MSQMIQEVPMPGSIFWEKVRHPDNVELIEGSPKSRKLPADKLRKLRLEISFYQAGLNAYWREYIKHAKRTRRREKDAARRARLDALIKAANGKIKRIRAKTRTRARIRTRQDVRAAAVALHLLNARLEEHRQALKDAAIHDKLAEGMKEEIAYFASQIQDRWSALGYSFEYTDPNGNKRLQRPKFAWCEYDEDRIQLKVLVTSRGLFGGTINHLPRRVKARDLVSEETLAELSSACECPVTSPHVDEQAGFENGCWLIVHRVGMRDGLFNYVSLEDVLAKYNQGYRKTFAVPVGVKAGRVIEYLHLTKTPHVMLNGIPGSGKTNLARCWLAVWSSYFSPDEIRFVVIDLKQSGDYNLFGDIPHMLTKIIKEFPDVLDLMPRLLTEHERRMRVLSTANVFDIDEYNERVGEANRLPHIVILLDEAGTIRDSADTLAERNEIFRVLARLSMVSRASGIHLLLGTQQGAKDVLPTRVTNNVTYSISGRQRTMSGAMSAMGNSRAKELPAIQGRMMVDSGFDQIIVQTPHGRGEDLRTAIEAAKQYPAPAFRLLGAASPPIPARPLVDDDFEDDFAEDDAPALQLVTKDRVIALALQGDGTMSAERIYIHTGKVTPIRQIQQMIKSIVEESEVSHGGARYRVAPKGKGHKLVPA